MTPESARYGIPTIVGDDVLDLAFRQGEEAGRRRTWQLTLDGWRVHGTTAARLGAAGVVWDRFARRACLADLARRAYDGLLPESRRFLNAYTAGVNAGLADAHATELVDLDVAPTPWEPWLPGGILLLNHVLFSTFPSKLWRQRAAAAAGEDVVALFTGEPVRTAGSNAYVVGGGRTASGLPIVAGDPHRLFEAPNVYQQVHLVCPGTDVTGFTFPGVPGVQHFAHAGTVAWGITHAMADYQDLVAGAAVVERRLETIVVRDAAPETVEVVVTADGPVVADGLALRTPAWVLGDLGLDALLPLLRARSAADVAAAFASWVEPVNNLVVADAGGNALRQVVGRVPRRSSDRARRYPADGAAWDGWVELPGAAVGADEVVVTANQRMPGFDEVGVEFAPAYRADRIAALLAGRDGLTAADLAAVALDTERPVRRLDALLAERGHPRRPGDEAWYAGVQDAVVGAVTDLPALAPLAALVPPDPLYAPWFALAPRVLHALDSLLDAGDVLGVDVGRLVDDAVARAGSGPPLRPRRFTAPHAFGGAGPVVPAPAVHGEADSVCSFGGPPGTDAAIRGPVARYVWDLADRSAGGWVVPLGADGDLASEHGTDQNEPWRTGRLVPLPPHPDTQEDR